MPAVDALAQGRRRRDAILRFVADHVSHQGRQPTIQEVGTAVGLRSLSSVVEHLRTLHGQGLLDYEPWKPRSLTLTEAGWDLVGTVPCPCCQGSGRVRRDTG